MAVSMCDPRTQVSAAVPAAMVRNPAVAAAAITVVIADEHALFREALRQLLVSQPDFRVLGEAGTAADLVRLVATLHPAIVLLDRHLPGLNTLEVLSAITAINPAIRTLLLAADASDAVVVDALESGARGMVAKQAGTELLFKSIRMVVAGQYWVGRECVAELIDKVRARHTSAMRGEVPMYDLTPRERELIAAVVDGGSNSDIAAALKISAKTVKHHLTNIFQKVGVSNRLELALFAIQHRLPAVRLD